MDLAILLNFECVFEKESKKTHNEACFLGDSIFG